MYFMKSIIVDERIRKEDERALERLGFLVLRLPPLRLLPEAISSHADSLLFRYNKRLFTYCAYAEDGLSVLSDIREYHRDISISFLSEEPGKKYPNDCILNALLIGDRLFARTKSLAEGIKELASSEGLELVNTTQGYPACTTLTFQDKYAITADAGLAKSLIDEGIRVLTISQGNIALPPYEYGFIGGASFVYKDTVYFFGNLNSHPDGRKIEEFIKNAGYKVFSLSEGGLIDLGGAIVLD